MKDIINGKRYDTAAKDTKLVLHTGRIGLHVTSKGSFFLANDGPTDQPFKNFIFAYPIAPSRHSVPHGISPIDPRDARRLVEAFGGDSKIKLLEQHFDSQIEDA
jgi:hypothetical protein